MFKGFYTVATGMLAQQRRTEILTNNMANANTPGFKSDQSTIRSFPDMLMSAKGTTNVPTQKGLALNHTQQIGALNTGVYLQETLANNTQGSLLMTEIPTDVALVDMNLPVDAESGNKGAIYFRLQHPAGGEAYTRNGNFTLDGQGNLVNAQGLYVLSDTGQRIQLANDNISVTDNGAILDENGTQVATIGVAFAANPDVLMKQDNGLYRMLNDEVLPTAYGAQGVAFGMRHKQLESSNVDSARAMTDLLTAYRAFEANQKVLQAYDRSMDKAVNDIGRVQ